MPRAKRITWIGYPHLVIAKGNFSTQLFDQPGDYQRYLERLGQLVRDKAVVLYAFCLLPNELRLVLKPTRRSLAQVMQRLHCSHTAKMNQQRGGKGHVFYGRFQSIIFPSVDLLSVIRGVHLWPVRTGLVRRAENYLWSSHPIYLGVSTIHSRMIDASTVLSQFFHGERSQASLYNRYVEAAALEEDNFGVAEVAEGIGGNGTEVDELLTRAQLIADRRRLPSLQYLAGKIQLVLNISTKQLVLASRRQDLVMARRLLSTVATCDGHKTIAEIARFLERDKAQISRLVSQGIDMVESDETFKALYEAVGGSALKV